MMKRRKNGLPIYRWYAADVVLSDNNTIVWRSSTNRKEHQRVIKNCKIFVRRIVCPRDEDCQSSNINAITDAAWNIDSVNAATLLQQCDSHMFESLV